MRDRLTAQTLTLADDAFLETPLSAYRLNSVVLVVQGNRI